MGFYSLLRILAAASALAVLSHAAILAQSQTNDSKQLEDVAIKSCIVVYGAVQSPSRFELRRPLRLSEAIALAGGVTNAASEEVEVVHTGTSNCAQEQKSLPQRCVECLPTNLPAPEVDTYYLSKLAGGDDKSNPYLQDGDRVRVGERPRVYVVGNVMFPQGIMLEPGLTLTKAITLAGGILPRSNTKKIRVFRPTSDASAMKIIIVNLDAVRENWAKDLILEPYDIVEINAKSAHRSPMPSISPTVSSLPVRVIT